MALKVGELYATLALQDQRYNAALNRAGANFATFGRGLSVRMANVGMTLDRVGNAIKYKVSAPLLLVGGAIAKVTMDMDSLERGLTAVMGSADAARKEIKRLEEVAKLPGLGFGEAIQGSTNLQAAGMSAELARKSLSAFGNALATVGKGKAELDGVNTALTQIMAKGKVSAEEILQLQERVPQIRQVMKDAFGTSSTEQLAKMGVDAETFVTKIVDELSKLPRVSGGVKNSWENAMDGLTKAIWKVKNIVGPVIEWVSGKIEKLADWFSKLSPVTQKIIMLAGAIAALGGVVLPIVGPITTFVGGLVGSISAIGGVGAAVSALVGAISGPIGWIVMALAAVVAFWPQIRQAVAATWAAIRPAIMSIWESIKGVWESVKRLFGSLKSLGAALAPIGKLFTKMQLGVLGTALKAALWLLSKIADVISLVADSIAYLVNLAAKLLEHFTGKPAGPTVVEQLVDRSIKAVKQQMDVMKVAEQQQQRLIEATMEEADAILDVIRKRKEAADQKRKEAMNAIGWGGITDLWKNAMTAGERTAVRMPSVKELTRTDIPTVAELQKIRKDLADQKQLARDLNTLVRERLGTYAG